MRTQASVLNAPARPFDVREVLGHKAAGVVEEVVFTHREEWHVS